MCGKTINSLRRNVVTPLLKMLEKYGFKVKDLKSKNIVEISLGGITNRFCLFGGKDEASASLIQGITLSGVLLDEVVLMPRSFVEQAVARCSVSGSRLWFNCNPDSPYHWFKKEWIDKSDEKNMLYLKFTLDDNPSLLPEIIERYHKLYTGAFYERFVLGNWSSVYGCVYTSFEPKKHIFSVIPADAEIVRYAVSCDYGTVNPSSFGLWGITTQGQAYRLKEYYYDSKREGMQRTDEEHYSGLEKLCEDYEIEAVVCDPSARSFIECINRHGRFKVIPAKNDVINGIRQVNDALSDGRLFISEACADSIREFSLYRWDEKSVTDAPVKENDHAMDDIRYFVTTFLNQKHDSFFVINVSR